MGISVKVPIMIRTDDIGAMFMEDNASSGVRVRHIGTRYHFINDHVEVGFIKILFVKIGYNDS
jgi:hypothetical protein